jgi:primosomal protein N' (replication factor Y)
MEQSKFATTEIGSIVSPHQVMRSDVFAFARQVADRQCVAIGEILQLAIPAHMPRIPVVVESPELVNSKVQVKREALLTSKQIAIQGVLYPSWMKVFLERAKELLELNQSSILLVPEASDVEWLRRLAEALDVPITLLETKQKAERFIKFHSILGRSAIVVGTRSAIYAPVANLGLIAVADDSDDSYREVGSPHTHARDLALLRAGKNVSLLFAAPYRSVEVQRLVEIGYLKEIEDQRQIPRISFNNSPERIDDASLKLAKEALDKGTLLILLPRKGTSSAVFCATCGERLKCGCGGYIWEPSEGKFACRICGRATTSCSECRSTSLRRGRSGSGRTTAEIGKMFPGATIYEASGGKIIEVPARKNQVVVATPGSAPRLESGYAGLVVLDSEIWLAMQSLRAEQNALRDWFEAMELLSPNARVHFSGLGDHLGKPIALGQQRELARTAYLESKKLRLPPAVRVVHLAGSREAIAKLINSLERVGGDTLRNEGTNALLRFDYKVGAEIAKEIRAVALATKSEKRGTKNVRGLAVSMDELSI